MLDKKKTLYKITKNRKFNINLYLIYNIYLILKWINASDADFSPI